MAGLTRTGCCRRSTVRETVVRPQSGSPAVGEGTVDARSRVSRCCRRSAPEPTLGHKLTIERGVEPMALRMGRLTRWTDRVEDVAAWVLLAAGLLLVPLACTLGIGVHAQMVRQGQTEALDRTATSATLLERAPLIASPYNAGAPVDVPVTWVDRWGMDHTGLVAAPQGLPRAARSRSGSTGRVRRCPSRRRPEMRSYWPGSSQAWSSPGEWWRSLCCGRCCGTC